MPQGYLLDLKLTMVTFCGPEMYKGGVFKKKSVQKTLIKPYFTS